MTDSTRGVTMLATAGQDTIQALSSERDSTTVALIHEASGSYVRVSLDAEGRYRIWVGNIETECNGALVARGNLVNVAASRLMERKELRERYDSLCEKGHGDVAPEWLMAMTRGRHIQAETLDYDDLLDWADASGSKRSIPQRFRDLWRRLTS